MIKNKEIPFSQCVNETIENRDFIKEFDRLHGSNLSMVGAPIDLMIDKSTGRTKSDDEEFLSFFFKYFYSPVYNGGLIK